MTTDSLKMVADTLSFAKPVSVSWGLKNIVANHGFSITWSGLLVVFLGLGLIALTISAFNLISRWLQQRPKQEDGREVIRPNIKEQDIPEDHLIAITTAVELYRRLHLEPVPGQVTFVRGEIHTPWKTGFKFGQRIVPEKKS